MSDLRAAIEDAYSESETQEESQESEVSAIKEETQTAPVEKSEEVESSRDSSGRFSAKEENKEADRVEPKADIAEVAEVVKPYARNPFSSWKPAAQSAMLKAEAGEALTTEELKLVRAEAERRESDFHKGVSEFKNHSERAKAYDSAVAPYRSHLEKLGVDAPTAINALMRADVILRTSDPVTKANYFNQLAREYGIDLKQQEQGQQNVDPQTQYLLQQINELKNSQQSWHNNQKQQEQARATQEITSFATEDKEHFDAVRGDMADLLESGKASSMQQAYEMATWMNPEIRESLMGKQLQQAQKTAVMESQAQRAKTASVSVKGSSPSSGSAQPTKGSLRDILESNFRDQF